MGIFFHLYNCRSLLFSRPPRGSHGVVSMKGIRERTLMLIIQIKIPTLRYILCPAWDDDNYK